MLNDPEQLMRFLILRFMTRPAGPIVAKMSESSRVSESSDLVDDFIGKNYLLGSLNAESIKQLKGIPDLSHLHSMINDMKTIMEELVAKDRLQIDPNVLLNAVLKLYQN